MEPDLVLDCRGMRCPLPIIELARHIAEVEIGQVVAVVSEDPAAGPDAQAWCRMRGQEYVREGTDEDGVPVFYVRRVS